VTKKFVPVREVADLLGIPRTSAYRLVRDGVVPSVTIAGAIRVPAAALEEFASRLEAEAMAGSAT
jgi:excisionase family DNA binding protein